MNEDYVKYIADKLVERIDTNISYPEYMAEQLDNNISYSEYICQHIDTNIRYAEYIAEHISPVLSITKYYKIKSNHINIIDEIRLNCQDILLELFDEGIESSVHIINENEIKIIIEKKPSPVFEEVVERIGDYLSIYM